ncbi:response regulator [Nostoc sp. TCL26-01]|uniref:response regulator n=1 Tax=Nostoc sp. TCL26-01 TaxID=2576904 RepID=UPI0015BC6215|nr:response regulator [Nostoc sp. TCL26-01]QLE57300.1 response regulator [Nostoc sp. TCL26-01]
MKILVVEDDNCSAKILEQVLTKLNYKAEIAKDGETGLALAQQFDYDLLILDIMLPKLDGVSLCHQLRLQGHQMPILMLTSQSDMSVRVNSLEVGADDYIVKPFNLSELIARIRALLRRGKTISTKVLTWENLRLDTTTKEVVYAGKRLHLTPKEYGLLEIFLQNPRRVFSRSVLLDKIWSNDEFPGEEAVTTQIKGLRQKLKTNGMKADFIETVYGLGYRLKEETKSPSYEVTQKQQAEANVMSLVSKMGEEFLETIPQRLGLIEQAIAQISNLTPDSQIIQQAQMEAHRLAGSLGCYGFCESSKIAQNIEQLLEKCHTEPQNIALQLTALIKSLQQSLQKPPSVSSTVPVSGLGREQATGNR